MHTSRTRIIYIIYHIYIYIYLSLSAAIYVYIYMVTPPPLDRPRNCISDLSRKRGGGGGRAPLQNSSSFQKSKNPKKPNPSFGFLETRGICSKSKKTQNSSSFRGILEWCSSPPPLEIQKSKNPNPSFGFLETRGILGFFWILSKFLEFPKIRNWGWDFWIFGNSRNFGFFWILSKFLEFPKIRNLGWDFWIFGFLETQVLVRFF